MTIWKKFRDIIEEKLGVRFDVRRTDLEHHKWGNPHIDHFDNNYGGVYFADDQKFQPSKRNPALPGTTEALEKPVYDAADITATGTSFDLFTTPIGQSNKTIFNTNLITARQLPSPEKFTINRIGHFIRTLILADFQALMTQILFTFRVNAKIYTQGPLFLYPSGFGGFGQTTATNVSIVSLGVPGENGVRSLLYPIPLQPLDPFDGNDEAHGGTNDAIGAVSSPSLTATTRIWCILQGPFERAV